MSISKLICIFFTSMAVSYSLTFIGLPSWLWFLADRLAGATLIALCVKLFGNNWLGALGMLEAVSALSFEQEDIRYVYFSDLITPSLVGWLLAIGVVVSIVWWIQTRVNNAVDRVELLLGRAEAVSTQVRADVVSVKDNAFDFVLASALCCVCIAIVRALISRLMVEKKQSGRIKSKILSVGDAVIALTGAGIFASRGIQASKVIVDAANFVTTKVTVALSGVGVLNKLYAQDDSPNAGLGFVKEVRDVCVELNENVTDKLHTECSGKCKASSACTCESETFGFEHVCAGLKVEKHEQKYPALYDTFDSIKLKSEVAALKVMAKDNRPYVSFALIVLAIMIYAVYRYCGKEEAKDDGRKNFGRSPSEPQAGETTPDDLVDAELERRLKALKQDRKTPQKESDDRRLQREKLDDRYQEKDVDQSRTWDNRNERERWEDYHQEREELHKRMGKPDERPVGGKEKKKITTSFGMGNTKVEKAYFKEASQIPAPEKEKSVLFEVAKKRRVRSRSTKSTKTFRDKMKKAAASKEAGSFLISGLESKGGVCKVGSKWGNYVFAENHFVMSLHVCATPDDVHFYASSGVEYVYKQSEGVKFSHDMLIFRFRSKTGEMAPPSLSLAVPEMAMKEVMVVSYQTFEDHAAKKYRVTMGNLTQINFTKGREMAYYTAETDFGMSGAMCLNVHQKCVGFHNEKGGFLPVTVELLALLRGTKN